VRGIRPNSLIEGKVTRRFKVIKQKENKGMCGPIMTGGRIVEQKGNARGRPETPYLSENIKVWTEEQTALRRGKIPRGENYGG